MRRLLLLAVVPLIMLIPAAASALTVRDVLELTRAGLGDEILLALIDVDPSVFPIDAATLKRLKDGGVSERVIVAMIRSARTPMPPPEPAAVAEPAPAPEPQVVVIEHHDSPEVREVPVAYPVYIPVAVGNAHQRGDRNRSDRNGDADRSAHKPAEPVYWGWGGKLRPDAWQPSPSPTSRENKKPN
jgi:hypothetical protein